MRRKLKINWHAPLKPYSGGGEVNLPPPRDNAENSKNMQAEGLHFSDF